jgi:hypothetical protein
MIGQVAMVNTTCYTLQEAVTDAIAALMLRTTVSKWWLAVAVRTVILTGWIVAQTTTFVQNTAN